MMHNVYLYWRLLLTRFWEALAILLTIKNVLVLLPEVKNWIDNTGLWCLVLIILVSFVYSLLELFYKKQSLSLSLNKATRLTVSYGDLFAQDGMKVIPVNDYFDTHLGDGIVSSNTLHGAFLKNYQGQIHKLDDQIREQLSAKAPLSGEHRERKMAGLPQTPYPLGTSIRIVIDNKKYLLVALTRFNENEHVDIKLPEYSIIIQQLFYNMEQLCDANPIYMPLVGAGQSGVKLTKMQLLNTIIRAGQNSEVSILKGVHIILYGKETKKEINLNIIQHLFECWKGL